VLTPDQEIDPKYLRTIRQTLKEVILPEVSSAAGRNAAGLCDFILLRMIAALEELPAIQARHVDAYRSLLARAAHLIGQPEIVDGVQPVWAAAQELQALVPKLFEATHTTDAARGIEALELLAAIAETDANFRQDYEAAYKRAEARPGAPLQSLLVTGDRVAKYLDARFPWQNIRLRDCQQIPGGRSKLTVLLSVEPNAHLPEEMVIRIDAPGSAIDTTVLDEFPILAVMYREGIAAPEPLWMEPDPQHLGAPFLVMRRMPGAAAGDLWGAQKVSPAIGFALAEALAGIHQANIVAIWPQAPVAARDAVKQMLDRFEASWRWGNSTPSLGMEGGFGWLRQHLHCIDGPTAAVHGDAHFANLLALDDKLVCLLDWEFTHPGHPADDLAYCRPYVETIMPWNDFLAHYRQHGGPVAGEEQLQFFAVWGFLRNITFGANMLRDFHAEKLHGIQHLAIALNTRARIEALLSRSVATALARDAADTTL
jgi:aminoglycoside phosphotransferase (APT) family kinase protein